MADISIVPGACQWRSAAARAYDKGMSVSAYPSRQNGRSAGFEALDRGEIDQRRPGFEVLDKNTADATGAGDRTER